MRVSRDVCTRARVYACVYACMRVSRGVCTHACVCMRVCVFVLVYVRVRACMCVCFQLKHKIHKYAMKSDYYSTNSILIELINKTRKNKRLRMYSHVT